MFDGFIVFDKVDGMGCLVFGNDCVVLVWNYELKLKDLVKVEVSIVNYKIFLVFDINSDGVVLLGGISYIIYNLKIY